MTYPGLLLAALLLALPTPATAIPPPDRLSLDLRDADLVDVIRYFAEVAGVNLVVDPAVAGRVTLRLRDVPWDAALGVTLKSHGLGYELDGNVLYIAPASRLIERAAAEAALAEERALAEPLRTVVFRLSYAQASDIATVIEKTALSRRGSVVVDVRTNSLIVTDVGSRLPAARGTVRRLDR